MEYTAITPLVSADRQRLAYRARLATWFAGLQAATLAFAVAVIPLIDDPDSRLTLLGGLSSLLAAVMWWCFRRGYGRHWAPIILVVYTQLIAVALLTLSGGANSPFTVFIPLMPVFSAWLAGRYMAMAVLALWLVALTFMLWANAWLLTLVNVSWDYSQVLSRTFWLMLASFIALVCTLHFKRRSRAFQEHLEDLAEHDPLTGIGNRRLFEQALGRGLAISERHQRWLSLLLIDVDHFKRFNDNRGHADGDMALQQIAQVLQAHTRQGQDTVARYGGEEFVVVLEETDSESAFLVAEKIRRAVKSLGLKYHRQEYEVLTVTIGYASICGDNTISADGLLRRADAALYHGKVTGRDRVISVDTLNQMAASPEATPATPVESV